MTNHPPIPGWLTGWKQIAAYVGRSVMTAKRYHKRYNLPIRRGPGNMPHCLPGELDAWLMEFDRIKKSANR